MESIFIEIKVSEDNDFLEDLRNQGLMFDAVREALNLYDDDLNELSFEEVELIENFRKNK